MIGQDQEDFFEKIVFQYVNDIRKVVFSYVKNLETMDDIVQEVFLSVYNHLENFREESALKTWIYRIAINKSKDYLKSWHYRKVQFSNLYQDRPNSDNVEQTIMTNIHNKELASVVMSLPIKYREVIILYYYQEMDTVEISDTLNLNVNTVKTRLNRGRSLMKRRFKVNGEI
ncbi:sigma-70 family RNA polymerase sigma factor [Neobacillus terrae]|uniref:sigma-70 family RNA polymerase sigma factor n=1 Tax=Neobacillus terrae TaxID=3034837 RepID=UPI003082EC29